MKSIQPHNIKHNVNNIRRYYQKCVDLKDTLDNNEIDQDQSTALSPKKLAPKISLPPLRPDQIKQLALIDAMCRHLEKDFPPAKQD